MCLKLPQIKKYIIDKKANKYKILKHDLQFNYLML